MTNGVENLVLDLQDRQNCLTAAAGATSIYQLAADMGGMGFIENNKALCMLSVLINTHMLMAARDKGVERFFYSSSACVYNGDKQDRPDVVRAEGGGRLPGHAGGRLWLGEALQRTHVPPLRGGLRPAVPRRALPQRLWPLRHMGRRPREGPGGDLPQGARGQGISGKHEIEIWGDGSQTRSFMYIDDCLKGIRMIFESDIRRAAQPGHRANWSPINQLVDIVEDIAGIKLKRSYNLNAPKGVNGRNSDNTLITAIARLGAVHPAARRHGEDLQWIESEMLAGPAR